MLDPQMKRGLLEICILSALSRSDSYGYKLIRDLESCVAVSESTLYPILRRLETAGSAEQIRSFLADWTEIEKMYDYIREGSQ